MNFQLHPTEPANYTGSYTRVRKRIVDTEITMQQVKNYSNNFDANVGFAPADDIWKPSIRFDQVTMPIRLDTVLRKVEQMPNKVNSDLMKEIYQVWKIMEPPKTIWKEI